MIAHWNYTSVCVGIGLALGRNQPQKNDRSTVLLAKINRTYFVLHFILKVKNHTAISHLNILHVKANNSN